MLRSNLLMRWISGLMLVSAASLSWAQQPPGSEPSTVRVMPDDAIMSTLDDSKLTTNKRVGISDPAEVEMLFKEGDSILGILKDLNSKGFHIQFRENQFTEEMVLLEIPTAVGIDNVLREILEPWHFTIRRTPLGKVIVTPVKDRKKESTAGDAVQAPKQEG